MLLIWKYTLSQSATWSSPQQFLADIWLQNTWFVLRFDVLPFPSPWLVLISGGMVSSYSRKNVGRIGGVAGVEALSQFLSFLPANAGALWDFRDGSSPPRRNHWVIWLDQDGHGWTWCGLTRFYITTWMICCPNHLFDGVWYFLGCCHSVKQSWFAQFFCTWKNGISGWTSACRVGF